MRPNNGGSFCKGARVRALVCSAQSCRGLTKQAYGDRLCASFLSDRHNPDTQLSGQSYLRWPACLQF